MYLARGKLQAFQPVETFPQIREGDLLGLVCRSAPVLTQASCPSCTGSLAALHQLKGLMPMWVSLQPLSAGLLAETVLQCITAMISLCCHESSALQRQRCRFLASCLAACSCCLLPSLSCSMAWGSQSLRRGGAGLAGGGGGGQRVPWCI